MSIKSNKKITKNKRISLDSLLNKDYFFHRSGKIKMALNTNRVLDKLFKIKRVKSKVNSFTNKTNRTPSNLLPKRKGDICNDEQQNNLSGESVPYELANILDNNEKYFNEQKDIYKSIKKDNDNFLNYWHYIKKCREKTKMKSLDKNDNKIDYDIELDDMKLNNSDFNDSFSLNNKKVSQIFKKNPLLTNNYFDNFFYYISEMESNKKDNDKLDIIKNNARIYLEKLKKDLIRKKNKIKNKYQFDSDEDNSNDLPEFYKKINEKKEKIESLKIKQENKETRKMIRKTKSSLHDLKNSKNNLEEFLAGISPKQEEKKSNKTFYGLNFMTPQNSKFGSTSSTWFMAPDKKKLENNLSFLNSNNRLNKNSFKKRIISSFSDDKYNKNNSNHNKISKLNIKKLTSFSNKENNKLSKSNDNSKYNSEDSELISSNRLKKILISKIAKHVSFSSRCQNHSFKKQKLDASYSDGKNCKDKKSKKISNSSNKLIKCSSYISINLDKDNNNNSTKTLFKSFNSELPTKNIFLNNNIQDEYAESRALKRLYAKIKNKKSSKLTIKEINMISHNLKIDNKQIKYYNNIDPLELIKKVKMASNRINIPLRMRRLHGIDFNSQIIDSLKPTEKINSIIENLDKKYMEELIDYKVRNLSKVQRNDY